MVDFAVGLAVWAFGLTVVLAESGFFPAAASPEFAFLSTGGRFSATSSGVYLLLKIFNGALRSFDHGFSLS